MLEACCDRFDDDSLLLVDTPNALVLNLNDAKPLPAMVRALARLADQVGKPRILLCSYSPASLVNSFLDDGGVRSLKPSRHYVEYVLGLCRALSADFYLPFASQAVFLRPDSRWANDYRTTFDDLCRFWNAPTVLLPPYTTLDLSDFSRVSVAREQYRPADPGRIEALAAGRSAAESEAQLSPQDVAGLRRKLNAFRWLLWPLFPRGFSFAAGERRLKYDARRGTLADDAGDPGDFVIEVPKLTLQEAVRNDHVSDLGITMFVRIRLLRRLDPRKVYGVFVLFQVDDYGHLRSPRAFLRWLRAGLRYSFGARLPPPPGAARPHRVRAAWPFTRSR